MKLLKAPTPVNLVSLIIVFKDFISVSSASFYHDDEMCYGSLETKSNGPRGQQDNLPINVNGHCVYDDEIIAPVEFDDISLKKLMNSFQSYQPNVIKTGHTDLSQPSRDNAFDPRIMDTLEPPGHNVPLSDHSLPGPSPHSRTYPNHQEQPLKNNIPVYPRVHHNSHIAIPRVLPVVVPKAPVVASALAKLSDLDIELTKRREEIGLYVSKKFKLLYRSIPRKNSRFLNGIVYAPFHRPTGKRIYGGTGKLGLYVYNTESVVSLFQMKPDYNPPKCFSKGMLSASKLKQTFRNANWSLQIGVSGELTKIGADPSEFMTLWIITDEKVEEINFGDQEVSRNLSLQRGNLIVAVPTQLRYLKQELSKGVSYEKLSAFIKNSINYELDQLVFIFEF